MENEILDLYPGVDRARSYQALSLIIFHSESPRQGDEHVDAGEDLEITPFKEFMYLPTARTLMKIASLKSAFQQGTWPVAIPPMRLSYVDRTDLLESRRMQKFEDEGRTLYQLILDLILQDDMKTTERKGTTKDELNASLIPLIEDPFTDAMRSVWKHGKVTIRGVFTACILLDIIDIGAKGIGRHLIFGHANKIIGGFKFLPHDSDEIVITDGMQWAQKDVPLLRALYRRIGTHMKDEAFSSLKQSMLVKNPLDDRDEKRLGFKPIWPNMDPFFFTNSNLLYCGTLILNAHALAYEAAIAFTNHHASIFAFAHLYNALRLMELTEIKLGELEHVIVDQMGPIFAGELPTTPETMYSRFSYRLGLRTSSRRFNEKQPWKLQSSAIVKSVMVDLFASKEHPDKIFYQLEEQLNSQKHQSRVEAAARKDYLSWAATEAGKLTTAPAKKSSQ